MFETPIQCRLGRTNLFGCFPSVGSVTLIVIVGIATWLVLANSTLAKPPYKAAVEKHYGELLPEKLRSCQLCHLSDQEIQDAPAGAFADDAKPWNPFGRSLYLLGQRQVADGATRPLGILDRLRLLADEDADGDGVANELELLAGTFPGHADDHPSPPQLAAAERELEALRSSRIHAWRPFEPVDRPDIPQLENSSSIANPIDGFIGERQRRKGITSRPLASKEVLLRRVYLDLIGLPPTREELLAFLSDESPEAYAKIVDRLLASPQYGERWGRHWMDIWRYSDWAGWGEQVRDSHPHIWRWRDWIVESLNQDKPYDQMVLEMLAADELTPGDEDALRATGFLVRNYKRLSREQWMADTVDHTGRALLGVTFKCAQCHDHMYDPLLHEEYFQFRAVFEPYKVRVDPIDGMLDTQQVGLSRVYDGDPEAKTLFYVRGDERTPDPDREIVPGVPAYLGGGVLETDQVILAHEHYYPSLRPDMLAANRQEAQRQVDQAREALVEAEAEYARIREALELARTEMPIGDSSTGDGNVNLPELETKAELVENQLAIARRKHESVLSNQASLEARIAAEEAKYGVVEAAEEMIQGLAGEASRLERAANLAHAEFELLEAQRALESVERSPEATGERRGKVREARKKVEERQKTLDEAVEAASGESRKYAPLGEVYPSVSSGRRLALARWIASRHNPLTARVAVNHIWTRHFGQGLVPTVDEFGGNGQTPAVPELLDWLAAELMEPSHFSASHSKPAPWSMKHLHRLIVLSRTYRADSSYNAANAELDPENQLHWRMTPRRLEAEAVRDSILHVAGSLDLKPGGQELDHRQILGIPRRSLYFRHAPEKQAQFLQIFDVAAPTECYERRDSIIPQQALALANSELTIRESRRLARRLLPRAGDDETEFIRFAFQQVLGRDPTSQERSACVEYLAERRSSLENQGKSESTTADWSDLDWPAEDARARAAENLIHALFNHHEFVMLR